jgi:hypothetical protein
VANNPISITHFNAIVAGREKATYFASPPLSIHVGIQHIWHRWTPNTNSKGLYYYMLSFNNRNDVIVEWTVQLRTSVASPFLSERNVEPSPDLWVGLLRMTGKKTSNTYREPTWLRQFDSRRRIQVRQLVRPRARQQKTQRLKVR